jgi:hypothetical protein
MARFLPSSCKILEFYECRGTSLNGAANLSPVKKLVAGTGAVSRYNLSRSQKSVTIQDFNCGQMRVSRFNSQNELLWPAELGMRIKDQKKRKSSGP